MVIKWQQQQHFKPADLLNPNLPGEKGGTTSPVPSLLEVICFVNFL